MGLIDGDDAVAYLETTQTEDGSWEGSAYTTARVVEAPTTAAS